MNDFIKWLGVNDKVARAVVWMLIIMVILITINAALDSLGFPHYMITYKNLKQINVSNFLDILSGWIVVLLNFYSIIFLVFRISNFKKIFPFSILYLVLNIFIVRFFNQVVVQLFIPMFLFGFAFTFSNKQKKYVLYILLSLIFNTFMQGIAYLYKVKYVNFSELNYFTKAILSIDYFIIIFIVILVKEIYLKKRGDNKCGVDKAGYGLENLKKKKK